MPDWSRRRFLAAALLSAAALAMHGVVVAEGMRLMAAEMVLKGEMWELSGGYEIQLSPTLEDALKRGLQLTFVQELEIERPRKYWLSEDVADLSRIIRISYNALLRQYYVTVSGHSTSFTTLPEALARVGDFGDWAVLHQSQVRKKSAYDMAVRMYLDVSQLPKPLQVNAVGSQRWQLDSDWTEWVFRP